MELTSSELANEIIRMRDFDYAIVRFSGYSSGAALARDLMTAVEETRRKKAEAVEKEAARLAASLVAEPAWKPGDVIKSAKGKVLVRTKDGRWFRPEDERYFGDCQVTRPTITLHKEV